jgi:hypothetical protein
LTARSGDAALVLTVATLSDLRIPYLAAILGCITGCGTSTQAPGPIQDAGVSAAADAGAPSAVTGTWSNTNVNGRGTRTWPVGPAAGEIEVWTWNGPGGGPTRLVGTVDGQAQFQVPAVPDGPFLLGVRRMDHFVSPYQVFYSSEGQRAFDLGVDSFGAREPGAPLAMMDTQLAVQLFGPVPWGGHPAAYDAFRLRVDNGSGWEVNGAEPSMLLGWAGMPLVDGPGQGHEALFLHWRSIGPDGSRRGTAVGALSTRDLKLVDGETTTFVAKMVVPAKDDPLSLDLRRAEFDGYRKDLGPVRPEASTSILVRRRAPGLADIDPDTTTLELALPGIDDVTVDAAGANPYPADWERVVEVSLQYPGVFDVPGIPDAPYAGPLLGAKLRRIDLAANLGKEPVRPTLSPPRTVLVGGRPVTAPLSGVGTAPTITWGPPAVGAPSLYRLVVSRVEPGAQPQFTHLLTAYTAQRSFRPPPDLLKPGAWHYLRLTAISSPAARLASPHREALPHAEADFTSARFTP